MARRAAPAFRPALRAAAREWGAILGEEVMAAALLDRLLHHCHTGARCKASANRVIVKRVTETRRITQELLSWFPWLH